MVRKAVAALTGLGLLGGAGTVAYNNHGDATVKIKDAHGQVHTVVIRSNGGKQFSCPSGTDEQLKPYDVQAGRIELTLQVVRRSERAIEARYPGSVAPHTVVVRYRTLHARDNRLVAAYNAQVTAHNSLIARNCTQAN
jgi:hypothetical protein